MFFFSKISFLLVICVSSLKIYEDDQNTDLTLMKWTLRCTTPEVPEIESSLWENKKMQVYKKFIENQPKDACDRYSSPLQVQIPGEIH